MEIEVLKKICSGKAVVSGLVGRMMSKKNITSKTVRSKGQLTMQRFFYIMGGCAKYELNDRVIECKKGDIIYLPPDVTYVCYWDQSREDNAALLIQFELHVKGEKVSLSDELFIVHHDEDGSCLRQFQLFIQTYNEGRFGYMIKCQSILLNLIYSFVTERINRAESQKNSTVYKGIVYIENNYMSDIDVDKLANMCSLCPTAFRSQFHKITGMSPIKYKNYLTIKKAAQLLRTGIYTVSEVAYEVGINDVCYFNRAFKKVYGMPPGKYRSEHINKNTSIQ